MTPTSDNFGEMSPDLAQGNDFNDMSIDNQQSFQMGGGNEQQPQQNNDSEFDTDFDAGVEADENTDPKKYIQQLTGKLSTTLNSYNSENTDDDGLNKYVAKMIVKASTKNMDDSDKKEVIKAINTSQNDTPDDTEDVDVDVDVNSDEQSSEFDGDMQIQERVLTKKQIQEMAKHNKQ